MNYYEQKVICEKKVKYADPMAADRAAKNHSNRRGKPKHRVYECSVCFGWHLATKKKY